MKKVEVISPKERLTTFLKVSFDFVGQVIMLSFFYVMVVSRLSSAWHMLTDEPDPLMDFLLRLLCSNWICVFDWWEFIKDYLVVIRMFLTLCITVVVVVTCWTLIRLLARLLLLAARFHLGVLRVWWWTFKRVFSVLMPHLPSISVRGFIPEVNMPGSDYINVVAPKGQFVIRSGNKTVGHGARIGDRLVAPLHVTSYPGLEMIDRLGIRYPCPEFTYLTTDVGYTAIPPGFSIERSTCGPVGEGMATITGNDPHSGSVGFMKSFGFDVSSYQGSTRAGMSGALYVQGGVAVSMHLGGTPTANLGMPTEYIAFKLKLVDYTPESSDLALLKTALGARGKKARFQMRDTGDPDVVEVLYGGKYYRIDRDELEDDDDWEERVFGLGSDAQYLRESDPPADPPQPAEDPCPEYSGNEMCPAGKSSVRAKPTGQPTPSNASGTATVSQTSRPTTSGRGEGPKKSSPASKPTPVSVSVQSVKLRNPPKKKSKKSSPKPPASTGSVSPSQVLICQLVKELLSSLEH